MFSECFVNAPRRRREIVPNAQVREFGPFRLDLDARLLFRGNEIIHLTPKALDVLIALIEADGRVLTKDELMAKAWPDSFVEEGNLAQHISHLRKMLDPAAGGASYIATISKRGYRLVCPVVPAAATATGNQPDDSPAVTPGRKLRWLWVAATLAGVIVAGWLWLAGRGESQIRSIAVLPLQDHSGAGHQDYFADGLTEALIGELARIQGLSVTSRTSSMHYQGTKLTVSEIARQLGVESVVEGSVARSGDRVTLRVQLIRAQGDDHLWSETYERDVRDVPRLQTELAQAISHQISVKLKPEERSRLEAARRVDRVAFDEYLRGRYAWNLRTAASMRVAQRHFQAAIEADPVYASAYAGLADCYNQMGTVVIGLMSPAESRALALAAATRALEIDPNLAEAYASIGYVHNYNWNWAEAERHFRKAIQLSPSYGSAHLWYAHHLAARKRFNEALQEVQTARRLDPLSPVIQTQVGWILGFMGRKDEALATYRRVLEMNPDYYWAEWQLSGIHLRDSRFEEAISIRKRIVERSPREPAVLGALGEAYGLAGRKEDARAILNELYRMSRTKYVSPYNLARVHLSLGELESTFEQLSNMYEEKNNGLAYAAVDEAYAPIRSDPRFQDLLRQIGLDRL